ncbi:MAG TPA: hypothetical protein VMR21_06325 [Vicinamibacteria bacterium]|nr:hypothetical protein [Vicinamibacteria bacterium]
MTAPPASIARSTALLEAAGFTVLELAPPGLRATWHLAAFAAPMPGVLLVAVVDGPELPDPLSPRLAMPGGFHPASRRLIHAWPPDGALPASRTL